MIPMRTTGITFQPDRPTPTTRDLVIASLLACPPKSSDTTLRPTSWSRL
jgi:hypothetical protein